LSDGATQHLAAPRMLPNDTLLSTAADVAQRNQRL